MLLGVVGASHISSGALKQAESQINAGSADSFAVVALRLYDLSHIEHGTSFVVPKEHTTWCSGGMDKGLEIARLSGLNVPI